MTNKIIVLLILTFSISWNLFSQEKTDIEKRGLLEKRSYKVITFNYEGNNDAILNKVNKQLLANENIVLSSFNLNDKLWTIHAWLNVQKEDVLFLIGRNGIKTSNYKEEIFMKENKTISNRQFSNLNEKEQYNIINNIVPYEDYPKFIDTGNHDEDLKDYNQRKQKWINDNPEKYKQLSAPNQLTETEEERLDRINKENLYKN